MSTNYYFEPTELGLNHEHGEGYCLHIGKQSAGFSFEGHLTTQFGPVISSAHWFRLIRAAGKLGYRVVNEYSYELDPEVFIKEVLDNDGEARARQYHWYQDNRSDAAIYTDDTLLDINGFTISFHDFF